MKIAEITSLGLPVWVALFPKEGSEKYRIAIGRRSYIFLARP
jgi:hypothetical protein